MEKNIKIEDKVIVDVVKEHINNKDND